MHLYTVWWSELFHSHKRKCESQHTTKPRITIYMQKQTTVNPRPASEHASNTPRAAWATGVGPMRKVLLSVGTNHTLLGIRNTIFVNAGYAVIPAKSAAAALRAIRSRNLAAVIVGHALSPTLKERITEAGKQKQVPVIVLHASDFEHPILAADANLCGLDGAATVLEVLAKLICSASTRDPHRTTICASRPIGRSTPGQVWCSLE